MRIHSMKTILIPPTHPPSFSLSYLPLSMPRLTRETMPR